MVSDLFSAGRRDALANWLSSLTYCESEYVFVYSFSCVSIKGDYMRWRLASSSFSVLQGIFIGADLFIYFKVVIIMAIFIVFQFCFHIYKTSIFGLQDDSMVCRVVSVSEPQIEYDIAWTQFLENFFSSVSFIQQFTYLFSYWKVLYRLMKCLWVREL